MRLLLPGNTRLFRRSRNRRHPDTRTYAYAPSRKQDAPSGWNVPPRDQNDRTGGQSSSHPSTLRPIPYALNRLCTRKVPRSNLEAPASVASICYFMRERTILPNGLAWSVQGELRRGINVFRPKASTRHRARLRGLPDGITLRWRQSATDVGLKGTTEMTQTDEIAQIADSRKRMISIPSQIGGSSIKRSRNSVAAMPRRLSSVGKAPALLTSQATTKGGVSGERNTTCPNESTVARFGNIMVDFSGAEAYKSVVRLPFTAHEFRVLRFFIDNPGRVICRHELLDKVGLQLLSDDTNCG
jgi:hypothetical protein